MTLKTLDQLIDEGRADIRCPCGAVYALRPYPRGNGHWQADEYGVWHHWHGGYPGHWEPCEEVRPDGKTD